MEPKDQLRNRLSEQQWEVTQNCGTESAFSGKYWDHHESGTYTCVVCQSPLFPSDAKFDSGSGWPSYTHPTTPTAVTEKADDSLGMQRVEIQCGHCSAHLGHWFRDGPSNSRYCINSASLDFAPK